MVRYLYMRCGDLYVMSQVLTPRTRMGDTLLFQDLYFTRKRTEVRSTVREAVCIICKRGLEEGVSITAKKVDGQMRFFCHYHLLMDF